MITSLDESPPELPAQHREHRSGVLVLSSTRKLVYVNQTARALLLMLSRNESGPAADGALPKSVEYVLDEVLAVLRIPLEHHGWRLLASTQLPKSPGEVLLVNVFGRRQGLDIEPSPIVLIMRQR